MLIVTTANRRPVTGVCCSLLWPVALLLAGAVAAGVKAESRLPYGEASPPWLQAVGSLQVPGERVREGRRHHYLEQCSATLVVAAPGRDANTLVTAWHCLEFYRDLSRPITFTLFAGTGLPLVREAHRLTDGGGMHADWAILRLYQPVPATLAPALVVHPGLADPARRITMAGFSRDDGLGAKGALLTYDPSCTILRQDRAGSDSDCHAYRGASGGAVIQLSPGGEPQLVGVVSRGDSEGLSIYVPVGGFRQALQRFLR